MLEDLAMMPAIVSRMLPWSNQSPIARSWRCSSGGTLNFWRGDTLPASMRAAAVSTFSTDPGS